VVGEDSFEGDRLQFYPVIHSQILPQRQPLHSVDDGAARKIGPGIEDFEQRRACENHPQTGIVIVYVFDLLRPGRVFMHFVQKEVLAAALDERVDQVAQPVLGEPDIIEAGVERFGRGTVVLLNVLQQQGGLTDASRPFDPYQARIPFYLTGDRADKSRVDECKSL